jgi:hypothetical protein
VPSRSVSREVGEVAIGESVRPPVGEEGKEEARARAASGSRARLLCRRSQELGAAVASSAGVARSSWPRWPGARAIGTPQPSGGWAATAVRRSSLAREEGASRRGGGFEKEQEMRGAARVSCVRG